MPINFLDMFAGIGGFRFGLERLGGFECVGYCEIDKYAKQAYDAMYPTKGRRASEESTDLGGASR